MNLRQKNKRLKRELELLKKQTIKPEIIRQRADVIRLYGSYKFTHTVIENVPEEVIKRAAAKPLLETVMPYIHFDRYLDYSDGNYVVEASLSVVKED